MTDGGAAWDVFLSHSSNDKPRVRELRDALLESGLSVWFDEDQILAGHSIPLKIEEAIEGSETIVACLSKSFLLSDWTAAERASFMYSDPSNRRPTLIPVLLEDCKIPRAISHLRYVDYRVPSDAAIDQLVDAVRRPGQGRLRGTPSRAGTLPFVQASPTAQTDIVKYIRGGLAVGFERCLGDRQALIVLDLDGFANVNRIFGPEAADQLTSVVSVVVQNWCAQEVDGLRVSSAAIVRGTDEWFILIAGDVDDSRYLTECSTQLSENIRAADVESIAHDMFASACVAHVVRHPGEPVLNVMRRGLTGLRAAKRMGAGSVSSGPHSVRSLANEYEETVEVAYMTSPDDYYYNVGLHRQGAWGRSRTSLRVDDVQPSGPDSPPRAAPGTPILLGELAPLPRPS